jgi:hypothetical protein
MMLLEPNYQVFPGSCPSPKSRIAIKAFDSSIRWQHSDRFMLNALFLALRFLILVFSDHKQVALENAAFRHQLAVYTRQRKRPRLHDRDRLFWIVLKKLWKDWRSALEFVQPETVIGWQHHRFKRLAPGPLALYVRNSSETEDCENAPADCRVES